MPVVHYALGDEHQKQRVPAFQTVLKEIPDSRQMYSYADMYRYAEK